MCVVMLPASHTALHTTRISVVPLMTAASSRPFFLQFPHCFLGGGGLGIIPLIVFPLWQGEGERGSLDLFVQGV